MIKALSQSGLVKKVKDFFILEPEDGEFEVAEKPESHGEAKVIPMGRTQHSGVVISDPRSTDEVRKVSDDLRNGMIVVVNITMMEKDMAREFLNFLSGAAYAVNGNYKKIGSGVFLFTPTGVPISELQDIVSESKEKEDMLMFKDL